MNNYGSLLTTMLICACCSVSRVWLCDPMDCSMPGLPVLHHLQDLAQTHVHWFYHAIQPSHPLLSPSPPALNLSLHQDIFQWVCFSHQVAQVLELQFQHQSFQWIFRVEFSARKSVIVWAGREGIPEVSRGAASWDLHLSWAGVSSEESWDKGIVELIKVHWSILLHWLLKRCF